jgi:serine/threonine protein kinase
MVGGTLDRYTIESTLGTGGMGVVYKARDPELGRAVAIKVLPPDKVADPVRRQRFVQEARAASALNHPGIVTVYDIGSDAGTDFIVMEYIAGRTLDQVVPASGLPPKTALRYAVAIADALSKAHAAGLVHRDLKASNVMVTDDGHVKILDFGLAKLLDPADGSRDVTRTAALTDAGIVVGSRIDSPFLLPKGGRCLTKSATTGADPRRA